MISSDEIAPELKGEKKFTPVNTSLEEQTSQAHIILNFNQKTG